MKILDGEKLSEKILLQLKEKIEGKKLQLKAVVVLIGESDVSKSYVGKKKEACEKIGAKFELLNFSSDITQEKLEEQIIKLAKDQQVSGIVVQLPIPKNLDTEKVLNLIPINKDIDVLSEMAVKSFASGESKIFPPVVGAIEELLIENNISLDNKKIVVLGKGRLVGKPVISWLKNLNCDFEVIDRSTENIAEITKTADVIISGVGVPGIIKSEMVKDEVIIIDAGTSSEDGKVVGDIDKDAYKKASFASMVPGGVGPMTIAILVKNLIDLNS